MASHVYSSTTASLCRAPMTKRSSFGIFLAVKGNKSHGRFLSQVFLDSFPRGQLRKRCSDKRMGQYLMCICWRK